MRLCVTSISLYLTYTLLCFCHFFSWADPNVLFGPYDFAVNVDKLPPECKGGRGRDDGKVINATVDEFAIYDQQQTGQGGSNGDSSAGGDGGDANYASNEDGGSSDVDNSTSSNNNRRTQKSNGSYQYPDYTKDPPCEYFEQCHRNFPNSKTCNTHHYKEGLIHIAHTAGAQGAFVCMAFACRYEFNNLIILFYCFQYIHQLEAGHCQTLSPPWQQIQRKD